MKRGTPDHPKTKALMAALGVRRYVAVGLLESLWHFAAQYAKRGDVVRWENTAIGTALDWDGDSDALMQAFISSGYLDPDSRCRFRLNRSAFRGDRRWIRESLRIAVLRRDKYRCVYCGKKLRRGKGVKPNRIATLDHKTPYSQGGRESLTNLVASCLPCNSRKGARTAKEAGL